MTPPPLRLFLTAGEASGDRLGAALIRGLRSLQPALEIAGVGGSEMATEGLQSLFPMEELAVMGIAEVLPRYTAILRRIRETAAAATAFKPAALVTIDSPDFSLRVARLAKAAGLRTVHYVAPSVWAWRAGRAKKMARDVDQVLALLPFEPPHFEAVGIRCDFVGHPVVAEPQPSAAEIAAFRADVMRGEGPLLLVLPGSRRSEVERLAPILGEALQRVAVRRPGLRLVVPAAPGRETALAEAVRGWPGEPLVLGRGDGRRGVAFAGADAALAASGTVSLELAAARTPMVIAYDMAWLSWQIMSRMARVDTVTLVNLVSQTRAVPEFLGPACRPEPIALALDRLLAEPGSQQAALDLTMERLGRGGEAPGLRAARAVLDGLN